MASGIALPQTGRERNAADAAVGAVLLPAGAGKITASHALHGEHSSLTHQHAASLDLVAVRMQQAWKIREIRAYQVISDDAGEALKPEHGNLVEDVAFLRNGRGQDAIKGGKPVGGNQQQMVAEVVDIAHFTASDQRDIAEMSAEDGAVRMAKSLVRHRNTAAIEFT
ncbi:MAG: hypothetical protein U5J83_13145 [Bryobacterales bacterium]|nr:hypothetical protein [Bryobacterales bacterium]